MRLNELVCSTSTLYTRTTARAAMSVVVAVLAAAAPFAQGCATTPAPDDAQENGELVLQLVTPGPHGEIYHLANATFDITLRTGAVTTVDGGSFGTQVTVSAPPGITTVQLRDGWTLEKSVDGGSTFQPVSALLGSLNPSLVRVLANQPAFIRFDFVIRETNGTLQISLGVVTAPRELAGGFVIDTATDDLALYAEAANRSLDFAVFFQLTSLEKITLDDGTKEAVYTAFSQGSLGPIPQAPGAVAAEFYNDGVGTLSGPIATELAGAFLTYTVAAKPDGTVELSGSLIGGSTDIEFGPNAIDAIVPTLDADGFPNDEFWYDSVLPFTQTSLQGTLSGLLRMRHLLPPI